MRSKMLYRLYLDETGTISDVVDPNYFYNFILSGILVNMYQAEHLKIHADQIKFKYWGRTDVVFHSRDIGRREKDFSILRDPNIEISFHNDLINFLIKDSSKCIIIATNKRTAVDLGWDSAKIYEETVNGMIKFFIEFLHQKKSRGQIFIESAGSQKDISFFKKYIYYLSNGLQGLDLDHNDIKELLTSISFVSKRNFDIETQIADLLSYPAGYQCMCDDKLRKVVPNSYEDKMLGVLQKKIITIGGKNSFIKLPQ